jgi:hypothetical protein
LVEVMSSSRSWSAEHPRNSTNLTYLTVSSFSSPLGLPLPTNRCRFFVLHPSIFINSSNSNTLRLQHVQPLLPSWNNATPGWYAHTSSSLDAEPVYVLLQRLRLHVAPCGIEADGSSDSESGGGAGDRVGVGAATGTRGLEGSSVESAPFVDTEIGFGGAGAGRLSFEGADCGAGAGVSSTVECLPVVQGGISRNSSKVRTRGLQHFQPAAQVNISWISV